MSFRVGLIVCLVGESGGEPCPRRDGQAPVLSCLVMKHRNRRQSVEIVEVIFKAEIEQTI